MLNALDLHRAAQALHTRGIPFAPVLLRRLTQVLYGCYIGLEAEIGEGTELAYSGLAVVIHPEARIGRGVLVGPHVTIGGRSLLSKGVPVIGDDVMIGPGACLLGPIRVGDGAHIGANSVVTRDVPARVLVAGAPARVIRSLGPAAAAPPPR